MRLLALQDVEQRFLVGDVTVPVLRGINLEVHQGEFVAVIGPSGSGKSTLLNVLGCLVRPSQGTYRIPEIEASSFGADELAKVRNEHFGFIFQRYNLLTQLSALENVELPALYLGEHQTIRYERACSLLARVGLYEERHHRPSQLSGGQQQRVCIARALINDAEIILADEPTGALDSENARTLLTLLLDLHRQGRTIVLVTHDLGIAAFAERTVQMKDGRIISDSGTLPQHLATAIKHPPGNNRQLISRLSIWSSHGRAALSVALRSMTGNRLRSALTMLGVFIGTAAVVTSVAVSQSASAAIANKASRLTTNSLQVKRGSSWNDPNALSVVTMRSPDLPVLSRISAVTTVVPLVESAISIRYGHKDTDGYVLGTGSNGVESAGALPLRGRDLSENDIIQGRNVAVVDANARHHLFGNQDPLGKSLLIGAVPFEVVGVSQQSVNGNGQPQAWVPYPSLMRRILGRDSFDGFRIYFRDGTSPVALERQVTEALTRAHGRKDFHVDDFASNWEELQKITMIASLAFGLLATISLLVGGIGVMNIMLVAVAERTHEIGIRMAVGARRGDIGRQFLTEAVLLCVIGGAGGLVLAAIFCAGIGAVFAKINPTITITSCVVAVSTCTTIGVVFGWFPARNAARLDPILALSRE